jgi:hypothetical protein
VNIFHKGIAQDLGKIGAVLVALKANAVDIYVACIAYRMVRRLYISVDIKLNVIVFNSCYITHGISPF